MTQGNNMTRFNDDLIRVAEYSKKELEIVLNSSTYKELLNAMNDKCVFAQATLDNSERLVDKIKELELELYKQSEKIHIAEIANEHYQALYKQSDSEAKALRVVIHDLDMKVAYHIEKSAYLSQRLVEAQKPIESSIDAAIKLEGDLGASMKANKDKAETIRKLEGSVHGQKKIIEAQEQKIQSLTKKNVELKTQTIPQYINYGVLPYEVYAMMQQKDIDERMEALSKLVADQQVEISNLTVDKHSMRDAIGQLTKDLNSLFLTCNELREKDGKHKLSLSGLFRIYGR